MTEPRVVPIETIVRSNEKLLKALITVLSLKDETLLAELKTIFTVAAHHDSEIAPKDPKVWAEIRRELGLIDDLVYGDDERPEKVAEQAAVAAEPDQERSFSPRPSSEPR
jgi:hypothetical protein